MDEIRDPNRGKASVCPPWSGRPAGMQAARNEEVRDLGVDVVVEELIDERHDHRRRRHAAPRTWDSEFRASRSCRL